MRGQRSEQPLMLAWIDVETQVPMEHPLGSSKKIADEALTALSDVSDRMDSARGR